MSSVLGIETLNQFIKRAFFAALRFGVASILHPKTPLHKNAFYKGVIAQR